MMPTSIFPQISLLPKPLLVLFILLSHALLCVAEVACWQEDLPASFATDCRHILAHIPSLATSDQHASSHIILSTSSPFSVNATLTHGSCTIDVFIYGDPARRPRNTFVPYYPWNNELPPPLTELQTLETWMAMREGVEGIIAHCADHGSPGQEIFLVTQSAWCFVRVAGAQYRYGEQRTRRNQLAVFRWIYGWGSVRWGWSLMNKQWHRGGLNHPDHLFARTFYSV